MDEKTWNNIEAAVKAMSERPTQNKCPICADTGKTCCNYEANSTHAQERIVHGCEACDGEECTCHAQEVFEREERYIVTKIKSGKRVECVVIESDWPEYEPVWQMLQDRMEGRPNKLAQQSEEIASLKAQLAEAQKIGESGWLVESTYPTNKRPQWLGLTTTYGGRTVYSWKDDSNEAIRFGRQEDAVKFSKLYQSDDDYSVGSIKVTEHLWLSASSTEVAKYLAEIRAKELEDAADYFRRVGYQGGVAEVQLRKMANELRAGASQPTIKEE